MEDWKERLKAEYAQLKERYEKLKAYNNKKEVEANLIGDRIMRQEEYYSNRLLARQQKIVVRMYMSLATLVFLYLRTEPQEKYSCTAP